MIFSTFEHILTHISVSVVSIVITIHLITLLVLVDEIRELYYSSEKGMITTFFCITGLLVTRWIFWGHLPLSNLYESLLFLSWSLTIIHIIPYLKKNKTLLNLITAPSALLIQGFATSGFLTEVHQSTTLVPALQSQWLVMHVSMMILAYAALLCGSLLGVALLVITFRKITKIPFKIKNNNFLNESFFLMRFNP
uniref:cytochrome c heme attachment protein n=1 Tax=Parnassia gansuensis TaxID=2859588 RepID=UPI0021ACFF81|nr:cytochrome c heme attachment protein [Parnassia gansuensis]UUA67587.1 cytochrome c heme attachment protein [Parnassia gansuensis]